MTLVFGIGNYVVDKTTIQECFFFFFCFSLLSEHSVTIQIKMWERKFSYILRISLSKQGLTPLPRQYRLSRLLLTSSDLNEEETVHLGNWFSNESQSVGSKILVRISFQYHSRYPNF